MRTHRSWKNGDAHPAPKRGTRWITPVSAILSATFIYAGALTLDADLVGGVVLLALGLGAALNPVIRVFRLLTGHMAKQPTPRSGVRRKPNTVHLKIVERDKDDRPTIH